MKRVPPDVTFSDFDWRLLAGVRGARVEAVELLGRLMSRPTLKALQDLKRLAESDRPAAVDAALAAFEWLELRHPSQARRLLDDQARLLESLRDEAGGSCDPDSG